MKQDKEGRRERPSGTVREQCTKVPRIDSASFLENFWPVVQGASLVR